MVPVVISILLVVLMSGAVLKVVADDRGQPTREAPPSPSLLPPPLPPPPPRLPATSRLRPAPAPMRIDQPPVVAVPSRSTFATTVRLSGPPLMRHRVRSGLLLVVLVVIVGTMVAALIGAVFAALAFVLRSAVTS